MMTGGLDLHVLLAHAEPMGRQRMAYALRAHGYRVSVARDGRELLERLTDLLVADGGPLGPDLIVIDELLAGCDGRDLRRRLHDAGWHIPVILLTDDPGAGALDTDRADAPAVLCFPFDTDDLRVAGELVIEAAAVGGRRANDRDALSTPTSPIAPPQSLAWGHRGASRRETVVPGETVLDDAA